MVGAVSTDELEKVMSEVESLITKGDVGRGTAQKEIKMRLSWCLEQLHAKLNENRILTKDADVKNKKKLQSLESELMTIKAEVVELKEALLELNAGRELDLKRSLKELDRISFKRFDVFDRKERNDLQKIYEGFKEATKSGDDGAVQLMELIMKVEAIEQTKEGDDVSVVREIERTTLATIADIYSGLFPSQDQESEVKAPPRSPEPVKAPPETVKEPPKPPPTDSMDIKSGSEESRESKSKGGSSNRTIKTATTDAKTEGQTTVKTTEESISKKPVDVTSAGSGSGGSESQTSLPRPIIQRSTKEIRVPDIPQSSLPKFPLDKEVVSETGGGGSDGDGGFGDGDRSGDEESEGPRWFLVVFGILLILVSIVIFLPEDKTEVIKKLRLKERFEGFTQSLGKKTESVDDKKIKNKKR